MVQLIFVTCYVTTITNNEYTTCLYIRRNKAHTDDEVRTAR
jgi:hypothetical protein